MHDAWAGITGPLGATLKAANIGVWRIHMPSGLATWDSVAASIMDGGSARPQCTPIQLPIHPDDVAEVRRRLGQIASGAGEAEVVVRLVRPDGCVRWVRASARPETSSSAPAEWILGIVRDVTEEVAVQEEVVERERQLSTLMDHLPGMAYRCEVEQPWRLHYVSKGVTDLTGREASELMSGGLSWAELIHPDDVQGVGRLVDDAVAKEQSFELTYRITSVDGQIKWVQERGRAYYEDGKPKFLEGFIWDVTAATNSELEARWIAHHDPLTRLPNRLVLQETLDLKVECPEGRFAVLLLDVDNFKRTNDTKGHDAGDALLSELANRLISVVRPGDLVVRLGGDEFAIVANAITTETELQQLGTTILDAVRAPLAHRFDTLSCSVSIGASVFPRDGKCRTELLKHADVALYAAKEAGRGVLKSFRPEMMAELQARTSMIARAGSALSSDGIFALYQPKVDLQSGNIAGYEALLRWQDPTGQLQLPNRIFAAFEDPLLACQLGDRMIECVISDLLSWMRDGLEFGHVAINVSPPQFRNGDFAERLLTRLRDAGIPAGKMQVEVTESVLLGTASKDVERALQKLERAGVEIALDDFGTGYASLLHLAHYPVSTLKIDCSFVRKLLTSSDDAAIIKAVVNLGHSLGMKVVAEGVESVAQEARLKAKGCDYAQGFLYSPAMTAADVALACQQQLCRSLASV